MEQHGVDVQFNRQQNIFVVGIDKDDRGVRQQFGVLFRDYTYQRILGGGRVKRKLCQRQHTTTVDYVKRSGCGGHVERGNNARRVVFHIDIDWNTDGGAIDDGSLTNQSTSPTYISGLSSNIKLLFHDYALLHASVVAGYY
jgi:hypothetical protein